MNCISCGKTAHEVREVRPALYKGETVEVEDQFFRCEACGEEFVTPDQIKYHARAVKDEVRRKYGLLSPDKIVEIRNRLGLTQAELEQLLGTGEKVVVRWENGKVVQSAAHDLVLRMLDRNPGSVKLLQQLSELRAEERRKYTESHSKGKIVAACTTG